MRAPAICDKCGTIFASGFEINNCTDVLFESCSSGPCPSCGSQGHVPDGLYNFIDNTIQLLRGPSRTVAELQRLADILTNAQMKHASYQEVTNEIEETLPELSSITAILPRTRTQLYAFILVLLSAIAMILGEIDDEGSTEISVESVITNVYQQPSAPYPASELSHQNESNNHQPYGSSGEMENHMKFTDNVFENTQVKLDDNEFTRCKFVNCEMVYSGRKPPLLVGCQFTGAKFTFSDHAANTLQFMKAMYHGGFQPIIEDTWNNIKQGE